jgi:hypothetical protein
VQRRDQTAWRGALKSARQHTRLARPLELARVDFEPSDPQPSGARVVAATLASVIFSLLADALIVVIAETVFPSTKGYPHFQFSDYAKLTVIGVVIAGAAWPVVTRVSSSARWLFFRMAILVTLVLWLPDLYILVKGQPVRAVAFLALMHLAIALVTYNLLVRVAPCGVRGHAREMARDGAGATAPAGRA